MSMQGLSVYFFLQIVGLLFIQSLNHDIHVSARKDDLHCDACRAVIREANWKVSREDPKKMVKVGSFRVDPNGNQPYINEKKYARSVMHLEDVFESICDRLQDYAELTNDDGSKDIVRFIGMDGTRLQTKDYNLDRSIGKKLRYQCEDFLENHEETVISHLQNDNLDDHEKNICGEETGVCSDEQLSRPVTELPVATKEEQSETDDEDDGEESDTEEDTEEESIPDEEPTDSPNNNEKEEL